jgi:Mrp family chromosome partitioning ATPase
MSEIFNAITRAGTALEGLEGMREPQPVVELPREDPDDDVPLPRFAESTVDAGRMRDRAMRAVVRKDSLASEQMRVLRTKVQTLEESIPMRCIGIVSPSRKEGKTTVAFGLATALAQMDSQRVLLLEASLRKPRLSSVLRIPSDTGLSDWLSGRTEEVSVRRVEPFGFWLREAGAPCETPADLLGHERMERLLARCRAEFDYVVVDGAALTPVADSVVLQDVLDGFFLVVRSRFSREDVVRRALSNLKRGSIKGVVFHAHRVIFR